jgi:hypothetical protein
MAATAKQYAVIEARWTERPSERFVISYTDEESVRELLAGPNILACGFSSSRDAEAHISASLIAAAPPAQPGSGPTATRNDPRPTLSRGGNLEISFCLIQTWKILRKFSMAAFAATVLVFYSRNEVFTVIRSLIGSTW